MAQYTPNFNLYEPDSSDDFADFRTEFNNNMNIIDQNLGGGGGSGGHTIYDKDGNALAQESGLQFTGSVNVTDDNVNGRTVVDVSGGSNLILDAQIYSTEEKQVGVWIDNKPLYQKTLIGTYNSSATSLQIDVSALNIDKIGNAFLSISSANYMAEVQDYYSSASDHIRWYYEKSNNKITLEFGNTYPEKPFEYRLTIQYTKTTDVAGSGGYEAYGFSPVIYSDVERKIGVWRDNKPLYQRTFVYTPMTTISSTTVIANLSSNIEIKDIHGVAINSQNDRVLPISYSGNNFGTNFATSASNDLQIEIYDDTWGTNYTFLATVQYTKTTDVAGSGDYNTYGVPTVHYSTSEQVIGTWLGKPLYQKVFTGLSVALGSDWVNAIDISSLAMEDCTFCIGIVPNTYQTPLCTRINGNYLQAYMNGMGGVTITTIVIQYTKTTDV